MGGECYHGGGTRRWRQHSDLEQLCRYVTRPAIANERLSLDRVGQVMLKLKTPWRNGTTHIVMSPMEFMQRLAALAPRALASHTFSWRAGAEYEIAFGGGIGVGADYNERRRPSIFRKYRGLAKIHAV